MSRIKQERFTSKILQDAVDLKENLQNCGIESKELKLPTYTKIEQMALKRPQNIYQ